MDVKTLRLSAADNRYTVREMLRQTTAERVLLVHPWELENGWNRPLEYEILRRAAQRESLNVAWVVQDPFRRGLPAAAGFPVFSSEEEAQTYLETHGHFPPLKPPRTPEPRERPPWAEEPQPRPVLLPKARPVWLLPLQIVVLLITLVAVGTVAFFAIPSATIRLYPAGATYAVVVPISVDPQLEGGVDMQRNLIPSHRVGDEFEAQAEVATTGLGVSFEGRSRGSVVFTNLLGQDYRVPDGTLVRTSAGSYPVRFETTQEVIVPAFGQAAVSVEALEEGPRGNVGAYQINFVEGVAGFALKVTNPDPIGGAESQEVAIVSEIDRERAWELAAQRVLGTAYEALQSDAYLEPNELLPRQTLVIQAVPKEAYTHVVGERAEVLGLALRLLITGQAVDAADAQAVAYRQLAAQLPAGYTLTDARFEIGESAEEDVGPGLFTFYVTTYGYATAEIEEDTVWAEIQGQPIDEVEAYLAESLPLVRPPEIEVQPAWFPFIPRLALRTEIQVMPGSWQGE
ncbi:MAG: baseplate J/gp47 family protein [Anaerolineales bacterium]